jgi:predicted methyltransferase MtxX (methanogen marker protein 4)
VDRTVAVTELLVTATSDAGCAVLHRTLLVP